MILGSTPADDIVCISKRTRVYHFKSQAHYCRIDSNWLSMFVSFISWKTNSESDSNGIVSLCLYRYSCGVLFSNFENDFYNYIIIFIVIVLGVNGSLVCCVQVS